MNLKIVKKALLLILMLFSLIGIFMLNPSFAVGQPTTKRVLLLHSYHPGYSFTEEEERGIREALHDNGVETEFFIYYLDAKRFYFQSREAEVSRHLTALYREFSLDCVIATDNDALAFFVKYRDTLFQNIPGVFCGINDFHPDMLREERGITGVTEQADLQGTVEIARNLFPDKDYLVFIIDNTATGTALGREIAELRKSYPYSITFIYLRMGLLYFREVLDLLKKYETRSIVFPIQMNIDRSGKAYTVPEAMETLRNATSAPLFVVFDPHYQHGAVGGKITLPYYQGLAAGKIALSILKGEDPDTIPIQTDTYTQYVFDHRQLEKYHIPRSSLPRGSKIIHEPESIWSKYSSVIPYILLFLAIETVTIFLLIDALRRNKLFQRMLERLIKEKELLIREVNHRVKNNLATVQSLLSIQKSSSNDPAVLEALGEAENRIQSVALTHQLLYGSMNTQTISIRSYLEKLVEGVRDSFQTDRKGVTLLLEVPEQDIGADMVRNIGLIVNEAVTNSLKHAFNGGGGEIQIRLQLEEGTNAPPSPSQPISSPVWILTVIDNGKGIAPEKTVAPESMGLLIIQSLTETLQGTLEIGPCNPALARPGTRLMVRFPAKPEGSVTKPGDRIKRHSAPQAS